MKTILFDQLMVKTIQPWDFLFRIRNNKFHFILFLIFLFSINFQVYSQGNIEFDFEKKKLSKSKDYPNFTVRKNNEYIFTINNINMLAYKMTVNIGDDSLENVTDVMSVLISNLNTGFGVISELIPKSGIGLSHTEKFVIGGQEISKINSFKKYLVLIDSIGALKARLKKAKLVKELKIGSIDLLGSNLTYSVVSKIKQSDITNAKIESEMANVGSVLIDFLEILELEKNLAQLDTLIAVIKSDSLNVSKNLYDLNEFCLKMLSFKTYTEFDTAIKKLKLDNTLIKIFKYKTHFFKLMYFIEEKKLTEEKANNSYLVSEINKQIQTIDTLIGFIQQLNEIDSFYFKYTIPVIPTGNFLSIDLGFEPLVSDKSGITGNNRFNYKKMYRIPVIGSSRSFVNVSLGFAKVKNSSLRWDIHSRVKRSDNTDSLVFYKLSKDSGSNFTPVLSSNIYHLWRVNKSFEIGPSFGVSALMSNQKLSLSFNGGFTLNIVDRLSLNFGVLLYNQRIVRPDLNFQNYIGVNSTSEINDDFFITRWTPSFMFSIGYSIPLYKTTQSIKIKN